MNTKRFLFVLLFITIHLVVRADGRITSSFNSGWSFKKGPAFPELALHGPAWNNGWQEVDLPHTWNAKDMQMYANNFYEGTGYYRKTYVLPTEWKEKRIFLRFEGVGAVAEVYVNGTLATSHKGGVFCFLL